ncbi:hypothetical protein MUK70_14955 [Dyadobacter chenwenxiniae]|uniref:Short chain dehydrogenase n=1 Tax=Dyadobacter chenwenxiniae TaxID=2906456 RepID=A0A9X1PH62_9BACT|nr:hypothetical protein [Dyadobacter chenwenxiniae]MCF0060541.1 hypothetical protein [Dyadobacter chenwenxiniae]UON86272.1 hypothetical protein MUK70_14955 [Dyadobacter chenwenxiniae]
MNFSVIRSADTLWGSAAAMELAMQKRHLILLGKELPALESLSQKIRKHADVHVQYFQTDDASTQDIIAVCDYINMHYEVDMLFNFAEIGFEQKLEDYDIHQLDIKLKVNHAAGTLYLHQLLPNLLLHGHALVMQFWCCAAPMQPWQEALVNYNLHYAEFLNSQWKETGLIIKNFTVEVPRTEPVFTF